MWLCDQQFGFGRETFYTDSGVNNYEGSYVNSMKHGNGIFTWANGSYFHGQFVEDKLSGEGLMRFTDGRQYIGTWDMNEMHGEGVFTWPDGRWYEGKYYYGRKNGPGIMEIKEEVYVESETEEEGQYVTKITRYDGNWSMGQQHGQGYIIVTVNGKLKSTSKLGNWERGQLIYWSKNPGEE